MFKIYLFGYFRIEKDGVTLDETGIRSNMLLKLFVYLVMNRNRTVTNIELEKHLWNPNEIENPTDALKNLMCRLRNALAKAFGQRDLIKSARGSYGWNPAYELDIDVERFVEQYQLSINPKATPIPHIEKAIEIYQGMFLQTLEDDYWVNNQNMQYHSMYLQIVNRLLEHFWQQEAYESVEKLTTQALQIDEFDENLNIYKVRALIKQNKIALAQKFYYAIEKNTKNKVGINGAALLRSIKKEMHFISQSDQITIDKMRKDIVENSKEGKTGSFQCEYEEFKSLYYMQAKKNARRKEEGYIILFTGSIKEEVMNGANEVKDFFVRYMVDGMEEILLTSLREFDVISRCSDRQYLVMLDRCTYENAIKVANRINDKFLQNYDTKFIEIQIDIQKIAL